MNKNELENSKSLTIYKKNILVRLKELLQEKKQELIESHIDPDWLKAFQKANKEFSMLPPINIDLREDSDNVLNIPYSKSTNIPEVPRMTAEEFLEQLNDTQVTEEIKENKINSSDELREAYEKIKKDEINLDELSGPDLLKLYAILSEELEIKREKYNFEELEEYEREIQRIEKENEILQEEIEELEKKLNNQ
ncbi:MAG: hypothetical protein IJW20_07145 [Clostridia bacterium]|nr:hypothetical protein [Clostridia bacterium]